MNEILVRVLTHFPSSAPPSALASLTPCLSVQSDPDKRKRYDHAGEEGVERGPGMFDFEASKKKVRASSRLRDYA